MALVHARSTERANKPLCRRKIF